MMIPVQFDLQSLKPCPWIESIGGTLCRLDTGIRCHYRITGNWNHLHWPQLMPLPTRRSGLWLDSCCELFVATATNPGYLELNAAPSGDWNCFEFAGYRTGMQETPGYRISNLANSHEHPATRILELTLESTRGESPPAPPDSNADQNYLEAPLLQIGIAVVIRSQVDKPGLSESAVLYYYSLQPGTGKPDFHDRDGFRINLEKCP